jgi:hypothetical protein
VVPGCRHHAALEHPAGRGIRVGREKCRGLVDVEPGTPDQAALNRIQTWMGKLEAGRQTILDFVKNESLANRVQLLEVLKSRSDPGGAIDRGPCWKELYSWRLLIAKSIAQEREDLVGVRAEAAWSAGRHTWAAPATGATAFPQSIGLAATWDTSLMRRVARSISRSSNICGPWWNGTFICVSRVTHWSISSGTSSRT